MRALVTGANGFVGHYLTDLLRQEDCYVHEFDRVFGYDVRNYEDVHSALDLARPDLVFHLAAQAYVAEAISNPMRAFEINTMGTLNLLEALRQTGSQARVMIAGTSEEYGYAHADTITEETLPVPFTPYGASKLAATVAAMTFHETYGLPIVVTRAFNHTGPGQSSSYAVSAFARRVARVEAGLDEVFTHGNLDAHRDLTDVRDIVKGYRMAIDCPPGIYNLSRGSSVAMLDVVLHLIGKAHRTISVKPDEQLHRPSPSVHFVASHEKLSALTGWDPEIPLEVTLNEMLDYWRANL